MKERLLAERAAQTPAAKAPAAQAGSAGSAIPPRAAAQGRTASTGKPLQVAAAPKARAIAEPPTGKLNVGAKNAASAGAKRGAAAGRRRGAQKGDDPEEVGERGRGRGRKREKQSPALMLTSVGLVLVAAAGAGAWFYFMGDAEEAPTTEGTAAVQAGTPAAQAQTPANTDSAPAAERAGAGEPVAADRDTAEGAEADGGTPPAETAAAAPPARRTRANVDPATVDLGAIETFGAPAGTASDEWSRIQNLVATALDSESGVAGTRAQRELEGLGKPAFAAIVNAMTKLDYSTEQGYRDGDIAQRMLRTISNGSNFEWRYSTEPGDVYFNKRVVESWAKVWARARTDEAYWRTFTKQTDQAGDAAGGAPKPPPDDLDSLDDI